MGRPRAFDEGEVLHAAREQFWSGGYAATSIDAVAAATGLGKGSLYGAFGDKHALYLRVFDDYCADVTSAVQRAHEGPDEEALQRVAQHLRAVAQSSAPPAGRRGCMLAKGVAELAATDAHVAARSLQTLDAVETTLVRDLEAAGRAGHIATDADPVALAGLLLTVLRGMEAVGKAGKSPEALAGIAEAALDVLPLTPAGRATGQR